MPRKPHEDLKDNARGSELPSWAQLLMHLPKRIDELRERMEVIEAELVSHSHPAQQRLLERFFSEMIPMLGMVAQKIVNQGQEIEPPILTPTVGFQAKICINCETQILYREGWPRVFCSYCGAEYPLTEAREGL